MERKCFSLIDVTGKICDKVILGWICGYSQEVIEQIERDSGGINRAHQERVLKWAREQRARQEQSNRNT